MSFIDKKTDRTVLRAKLTDTGRELLSKGMLSYRYWSVGDTEVDYNQIYNLTDTGDRSGAMILAPKDLTTEIKHPITSYVGGDQYNIVTGAQSIQKQVFGALNTRGFFNDAGTAINNDFIDNAKTKKYFKAIIKFEVASLSGSAVLNFSSITGVVDVGDTVMVVCLNPTQGGLTAETQLPNVAPYLYFKCKAKTATSVTLDRNLPTMNSGTGGSYAYVIKGGDPINDYYSTFEPTYWDYDNLSFQTNEGNVANDVKIWNFNIVYKDPILGLDSNVYKGNKYFPSRIFSGITNYDKDFPTGQKLFGVIHYTNNATTNIYGESYKRGSLKLTIPNVMYHRTQTSGTATTMGATFISVNNNDHPEYDELIDAVGNVIGRVYFRQQVIILICEELTTALSYRGNRSWTLPKMNINAVPSPTGSVPFVTKDKELYVTYYLNSTTDGFKNTMPCQAFSVLTNDIVGQESAMIFFPKNQFPFLKATFSGVGSMNANKVFLLAQLVDKGSKPHPMLWKQIDITTTFKAGGTNLAPTDLEGKTYTLNQAAYASAPIFKLETVLDSLPKTTDTTGMVFGEENVFMGSVTVAPSATIHKTSFSFPLLFNQFKHSINPTYTSDGGRPIYISEVGVYNENKELVIIGKTSSPLKKGDGDTILLQLDLDF